MVELLSGKFFSGFTTRGFYWLYGGGKRVWVCDGGSRIRSGCQKKKVKKVH